MNKHANIKIKIKLAFSNFIRENNFKIILKVILNYRNI